MARLPRPIRRTLRRLRSWWRGTPPRELGQTLIGIGVVLIVGAAVLVIVV